MIKIIAVGGGSMAEGLTKAIDREIISFTGKKNPNALFIPTASSDDLGYWKNFQKIYGNKLGCKTDVLLLLKEKITIEKIAEKISKADLLYVGGGNTLKMMRRWRSLGVDKLLIDAAHKGKVMAGTSAGALCWFNYGHSDSMFYYHPDQWDYVKVKCLGIVPALLCPHYLKEKRDRSFKRMIQKIGGMGLAVDDCCALQLEGDNYRVLQSREGANAFKIYKKGGKVIEEIIPVKKEFNPLKDLLTFKN